MQKIIALLVGVAVSAGALPAQFRPSNDPPTFSKKDFDREIVTKYCKVEYRADREHDAQQLATYVDHSLSWMTRELKPIDPALMNGFNCTVLQYSEPTIGVADNGSALSQTAGRGEWIVVSMLAQSSISATSRTIAGEQKDDNYTAKTVADELSTVLFERITRDKGKGWYFHTAPQWFVQGIEGYAGMTHSTVHERNVTIPKYIRMVQTQPEELTFEPEVHARNPYIGGLVFVTFLYRTYGASSVNALLTSPRATFDEAFEDQFGHLADVSKTYMRWIASNKVRTR